MKINKTDLHLDPKPLLKTILQRFFGVQPFGFMTMIAQHIPSPLENAKKKVETEYTGLQISKIASQPNKGF